MWTIFCQWREASSMATPNAQLFFPWISWLLWKNWKYWEKEDYQGGHSSLYSGSQMMHVVTEKQNGGPPMSWRKLQSQQIIQFALFTMGHLIVHRTLTLVVLRTYRSFFYFLFTSLSWNKHVTFTSIRMMLRPAQVWNSRCKQREYCPLSHSFIYLFSNQKLVRCSIFNIQHSNSNVEYRISN